MTSIHVQNRHLFFKTKSERKKVKEIFLLLVEIIPGKKVPPFFFFFIFKFSFNRWYPIPFRGEFFHAHVATPRDSCRDGTRRENWIQSIWRGFIREIDLWWWKIYRYLLSPLFKWNSTWFVTWKLEVKKWYHTINY